MLPRVRGQKLPKELVINCHKSAASMKPEIRLLNNVLAHAPTACADSGCGHLRTVCEQNCMQMLRMRDCLSIISQSVIK